MAIVHELRVFVGADGANGNGLAVFLQGHAIDEDERQAIAGLLDYSETVFVEDIALASVRIYTPKEELVFAGHPLVGAGWLLRRADKALRTLRPPAGEVAVW